MDTLPSSLQSCVIEDVIFGEEVDRGAHARILAATWEGASVAVKHIHTLFNDIASEVEYEKLRQSFLKECERSSQIRYPNIVRFLGIHLSEGDLVPRLVMERLSCNLDQLLTKHLYIPEGIKYNILHGVSLGIRFLHTRRPTPVIHRDLTSNNILVSSAMEGKISDLGTACFINKSRESSTTRVSGMVCADFMPPEVLTDRPMYSISVDLFSFGCVMLHTLAHEWPTPRQSVIGNQKTRELIALSELQRREMYMQKLINRPGSIPAQVKELITQCLSNYPEERPRIQMVTNLLDYIKSLYLPSLNFTVLDLLKDNMMDESVSMVVSTEEKDILPLSLQACVLDNVLLGKEIGRGAHGIVLAATWKGTPVAVKCISTFFDDVSSTSENKIPQQNFIKECERSIQIHHPNIVRFLGICFSEGTHIPLLVMEHLDNNLNQLLTKHPVIPEGIKCNILHGVSLGIRFLHTHHPPIIHRDVSSMNILVTSAMEGKVGDLGTARFVDEHRQLQMTRAPGTLDFMPPEVLTDHPIYGVSIDLFSFGCVMLHILSHEWPTPRNLIIGNRKTGELVALSELQRRETYMQKLTNRPGSFSGQVKDLISQCLSNYPEERPKIQTVTDQLDYIKCHLQSPNLTVLDSQNNAYNKTEEIHSFKVTYEHCANLLIKCWPTSITELDGKVYIIAQDNSEATYPYVYDLMKGKWSQLPTLPYHKCSIVAVHGKKQLLAIGGCLKTRDVVEVSGQVFLWDKDDAKWVVDYPSMPTARFSSSSISHRSVVIVAGGVTRCDPWVMTSAVEILSIVEENQFSPHKTHWVKVEQLPCTVYDAIPLIVDGNLYIIGGFDKQHYSHSTCKVVMTSLSELPKSNDTSIDQMWSRLPNMPYSSFSVNHYQGRLVTFTGVSLGEQADQDKPFHRSHLYNPDTKSWDYVANASEGYIWGRSVCIKDDVIFVVGGTTGTIYRGKDDNLVKMCLKLSIVHNSRKKILHDAF